MRMINPKLSTDAGLDGTLTLVFRSKITKELDPADEVRIILGPLQIIDVMRQFDQSASYALQTAITALAMGPCETCGNNRLVMGGRDNQDAVRCPDCKPRLGEATRAAAIADCEPFITDTHDALLWAP